MRDFVTVFFIVIAHIFHLSAFALDEARLDFLKQKMKSERSGPNCHNMVLYLNGIAHGLRYTSNSEFETALSSFCKEVGVKEKIIRGDVGVVRDQDGELLHSFIYLDDKNFFNKTGFNSFFNYETVGVAGLVYSGAEGSCKACDNKITRFRCISSYPLSSFTLALFTLEQDFQAYALAKSIDFYPNQEQLKYLNNLKLRTAQLKVEFAKSTFESMGLKNYSKEVLESLEYNVGRWIEPDDDD